MKVLDGTLRGSYVEAGLRIGEEDCPLGGMVFSSLIGDRGIPDGMEYSDSVNSVYCEDRRSGTFKNVPICCWLACFSIGLGTLLECFAVATEQFGKHGLRHLAEVDRASLGIH